MPGFSVTIYVVQRVCVTNLRGERFYLPRGRAQRRGATSFVSAGHYVLQSTPAQRLDLYEVFDHSHPPDRGYGYVAASRFRSREGVFLFGKIRVTDWRPVRRGTMILTKI